MKPRIKPQIIKYFVGGKLLKGVEFDWQVKDDRTQTRFFFAPREDVLYRWGLRGNKTGFVSCSTRSLSEKRRAELMAVWDAELARKQAEFEERNKVTT
jgi:hypothetical protein